EPVRMVAIDEDWSAVRFRRVDYIKSLTRPPEYALSARGRAKTAAAAKAAKNDAAKSGAKKRSVRKQRWRASFSALRLRVLAGRCGVSSADWSDSMTRPQTAVWIDAEIQQRVEWRDGDVVVSVPVKSGTTWTMNIVHQLREGGDPHFEDLYVEVPWLELVP